jgi:hypothetical protein
MQIFFFAQGAEIRLVAIAVANYRLMVKRRFQSAICVLKIIQTGNVCFALTIDRL